MYFAIKKIPFKKLTVLIIALLPMTIQEAVSLSPDALTIALSIALISYILFIKFEQKTRLNVRQYILLLIMSVILSLCKIVYLPLCFLALLISADRFKSKKDKAIKLVILEAIAILLNFLWFKYATRYLIEINPGVNSFEQTQYILSNIIEYVVIIIRTISVYAKNYIFQLVGDSMLQLNANTSNIYQLILFVILVLTLLCDKSKEKISTKLKVFVGIITATIIGLIFTSIYVQWNPVGNGLIMGIHGRYFIPIALLFAILLENKFIEFKKIPYNYIFMTIVFANLNVVATMIYYFS